MNGDPVNFVDPSGLNAPCSAEFSYADCGGDEGFWGGGSGGGGGGGGYFGPGGDGGGYAGMPASVAAALSRYLLGLEYTLARLYGTSGRALEGYSSGRFGLDLLALQYLQNSLVEDDPQKRSDTSGDKNIKVPEVTEQPDPNRGKFGKCFEGWRFSTAASEPFRGTRFHGAAEGIAGFLEIGPPISLGADATATAYKATQTTLGKPQPYASGLNWGVRRMATGPLRGRLTSFGNVAGPVLSGVGAFTAGYNLSVAGQCLFGVIK